MRIESQEMCEHCGKLEQTFPHKNLNVCYDCLKIVQRKEGVR